MKRRDFDAGQIRNIKEAYRLVYRKGLKLDEAMEEIAGRFAGRAEVELFLESLRSSERGLVR